MYKQKRASLDQLEEDKTVEILNLVELIDRADKHLLECRKKLKNFRYNKRAYMDTKRNKADSKNKSEHNIEMTHKEMEDMLQELAELNKLKKRKNMKMI